MLHLDRRARWKYMAPDQGDQGSGASPPENPPSSTLEHKEESPNTEEHEYVTEKRLDERLNPIEGKLDTILEHVIPKKQEELPKEEEKDKTPESPKIEVPGIKFIAVRKRGGRIVRRPVKEEKKEEEIKK